jgi:hypothetical protein
MFSDHALPARGVNVPFRSTGSRLRAVSLSPSLLLPSSFSFHSLHTGGVKGAATYDLHKHSLTTALTLNKALSGSEVQLRAVYKQAGDVFILEEQWIFDANNKLSGAYNFSNEEAIFAYTHTRDDWSATGRYNFSTDKTTLEIGKKQGKARIAAVYGVNDGAAVLTWAAKPFKASIKGNLGRGGLKAAQAAFTITQEFDL